MTKHKTKCSILFSEKRLYQETKRHHQVAITKAKYLGEKKPKKHSTSY